MVEKVALFCLRVASTLYLVLGIPLTTNRVRPFVNFASILDSYTSSSGSKSISSAGVAIGDAEVLGVAVGDAEGVAETLGVAEGVTETLGVADGVTETLGVADGVTETLGVADGDAETLGVADGDATTTEAVPSKTKSVHFICESVVCVLKVYVPAIKGVP